MSLISIFPIILIKASSSNRMPPDWLSVPRWRGGDDRTACQLNGPGSIKIDWLRCAIDRRVMCFWCRAEPDQDVVAQRSCVSRVAARTTHILYRNDARPHQFCNGFALLPSSWPAGQFHRAVATAAGGNPAGHQWARQFPGYARQKRQVLVREGQQTA